MLKTRRRKPYFLFLAFSALIVINSCGSMRTQVNHYDEIMKNVTSEQYTQAVKKIQMARAEGKYEAKDRVVYYLELGTAYHYAGMYDSSNVAFELADEAMDDLFTKSISKAAASVLLNDNALDYFGEDYEQVYVNIFKAINYINLGNREAAMVEIRRMQIKLNEFERKYAEMAAGMNQSKDMQTEVKYDNRPMYDNVFGRYMSMSLYRAGGYPDDAEIDHRKISELYKTLPHWYPFKNPKFLSSPDLEGRPLQVLAFTGKAPEKYAVSLNITTYKNWLHIRSRSGKKDKYWLNIPMKIDQGYHFKFELPEIRLTGTKIKKIKVFANNSEIGQLELVEDMQTVANKAFETHQTMIMFKTVIRAVAKGLAAAEAKKKMRESQKSEGWGFVTDLLTDIAVDATENADLRFWRTMPGFAWAGEFNLEPGVYSIKLVYLDNKGMVRATKMYPETRVNQNGINFVESFVHF